MTHTATLKHRRGSPGRLQYVSLLCSHVWRPVQAADCRTVQRSYAPCLVPLPLLSRPAAASNARTSSAGASVSTRRCLYGARVEQGSGAEAACGGGDAVCKPRGGTKGSKVRKEAWAGKVHQHRDPRGPRPSKQ